MKIILLISMILTSCINFNIFAVGTEERKIGVEVKKLQEEALAQIKKGVREASDILAISKIGTEFSNYTPGRILLLGLDDNNFNIEEGFTVNVPFNASITIWSGIPASKPGEKLSSKLLGSYQNGIFKSWDGKFYNVIGKILELKPDPATGKSGLFLGINKIA